MAGNGKNQKDWFESGTVLALLFILGVGLLFAGAWLLGYAFTKAWGLSLLIPMMPAEATKRLTSNLNLTPSRASSRALA